MKQYLKHTRDFLKPYTDLRNYKKFIFPVLVMFGIYLLGISSIIRADFFCIDDYDRAVKGFRGWEAGNRYVSNMLAVLLHTTTRIKDISPLPQIVAMFILTIASIVSVYILCDKKITTLSLIASLPIGLSPWFLFCISYKFDAPYMALSVLVFIVPFLFTKNRLIFVIISVFSILIMLMTYQSSSGIYIMFVVVLIFKYWISNTKKNRDIFNFLLISVLCYCAAMIIFRFFIMQQKDMGYASTDMYSVKEIFSGILHNFVRYTKTIIGDMSITWKVLTVLMTVFFVITTSITSKRNKFATIFLSVITVAVLFAVSYGLYLVLKKPLFSPRGCYAIGILIAILCICTTNYKKSVAIPAIVLCWCFFVYAFSFGNVLSEQKRYETFRTEVLLKDLSTLFPNRQDGDIPFKIKGYISLAPPLNNVLATFPITKYISYAPTLAQWSYGPTVFVANYYNSRLRYDESIDEKDLDTLLDTYYHTIKSDGKRILVVLK